MTDSVELVLGEVLEIIESVESVVECRCNCESEVADLLLEWC